LGIGSSQLTCAQDAVDEPMKRTIANAEVTRMVDG